MGMFWRFGDGSGDGDVVVVDIAVCGDFTAAADVDSTPAAVAGCSCCLCFFFVFFGPIFSMPTAAPLPVVRAAKFFENSTILWYLFYTDMFSMIYRHSPLPHPLPIHISSPSLPPPPLCFPPYTRPRPPPPSLLISCLLSPSLPPSVGL